jgi:arabinofuranosyltransferase
VRGRDDLVVALAALPPLALFLVREHLIAGEAGFPLDDSWIHLHFARNLVEGAGFSYNPGVPVAGSTAPLWTLLLAASSFALGGVSLVSAKLLGTATALAAAILTRRAALAWGATPELALASGIALAWTGAMAWGALSGMEVPLAVLLVSGALLAHAQDRVVATALLAALAVLARPEVLLLIPLLALARPMTLRRGLAFTLIPIAVLAPAVAFSLATLGAPYPATAAAKVEGGLLGWLAGVRESPGHTWLARPWAFVLEWVDWLRRTHWLLPAAAVAGVVGAWVRRGRALGVPALVLVVQPLGMALLAPYRGPAFQEGRYATQLLPVALVAAAVSVGRPSRRIGALMGLVWLAVAAISLPSAAERYAWGVQNINAMQVHLGRWVDRNLPTSARLAVNDIGAIAFFSRREIIDLVGLVTPEILPYRREGDIGVMRYVAVTCPDYLIIFPTWFPRLAARDDLLVPTYRVRLARPEVTGGPEMVVYRLTSCTV